MFEGLKILKNHQIQDSRGFFQELWNKRTFSEQNIHVNFVQTNHSRSYPNSLRGLHYQIGQGKLVGVVRGSIWNVVVDIRNESPTRGKHFSVELSEVNGLELWIPPGFANGFCVLGDTPADVLYHTTDFYNPAVESGIRWNDSDLAIQWPSCATIISERDQALPMWKQLCTHK